jgi:predicted MPP superfamily phosphohydrolase
MFWFWATNYNVMLAMDLAFWVTAIRLAKGKVWRIMVTVFVAAQLAGLVSMMAGYDWVPHGPKGLLVAVIVWHYSEVIALPLFLVSLGCFRIFRRISRNRGLRASPPPAASKIENPVGRREFIGTCAAMAPPFFTVGMTGFALAQLSSFRVRRFKLPIHSLPPALDGMTIAHVSDIHVGRMTCGRVLRTMVNTTNSLRTDLVLFTGDLINSELSDLSEGIELVRAMQGRYGQCMIEGNHDLFENGAEFVRRVKAAGVPLLLNESATCRVRGFPVQLFGLRWTGGGNQERDKETPLQLGGLLRQRHHDAFPILLSHHPHAFDAAARAGLPLTLAGHTHGGQLMFDKHHGVGPAMFRYWSGLYERGNSKMIVSNGVGNWFPLRVNAPAEIVHITLRGA